MARKKLFERSEVKYILYSLIVIAVLMLLINVPGLNSFISSWNPILQFLFINLGIYFSMFFFLRGVVLKDRSVWKFSLGNIISFSAFDLILGEYHVSILGLNPGAIFGKSAIDYVFGYIYSSLGAKGLFLVILTYPFTFVLLLSIGALVYKNFIKSLGGGD